MSIKVYLNTTANPPVTCDPPQKEKDRGKRRLSWEPASGQKFDFVSLTFVNNPGCFDTPKVKKKKITANDDNSGGSSVGTFLYVVVVSKNGTNYSSAMNAARAKPPATVGGADSPTIRNN
jgi:hypothetical protein